MTRRELKQLSVTTNGSKLYFCREVAGDRVNILLPSISNTMCKCLTKTINFVNTDKPCRNKLSPVKKLSAITWQDSKNLLVTKLLCNFS